jgi:hypothetical protein
VEEIRQAYKRLVRLLHPDHCGDEAVRKLADLQMMRLNALLATLANPVEREAYDRTLAFAVQPGREPPRPSGLSHPPWLVLAPALMLCGLAAFLVRGHHPETSPLLPPGQPASEAGASPAEPPPHAQGRMHTGLRKQPQPDEAPADASTSGDPLPEPTADMAEPEPPPTETRGADVRPSPVSGGPETRALPEDVAPPGWPREMPSRTDLAGEWLFVASPHGQGTGLYPPEYIELRVSEDAGILRGNYRARYRVTDRAISPTVAFQFEGPAPPEGGSLPWRGSGGARGEVKLRLLTSRTLEVTWIAHHLGGELGLISGTATLIRKLD